MPRPLPLLALLLAAVAARADVTPVADGRARCAEEHAGSAAYADVLQRVGHRGLLAPVGLYAEKP